MAFRPPTFNLNCNLWRKPNVVTNPPDRQFMVNLSLGRRVMGIPLAQTNALAGRILVSEALCPALTDIVGVVSNVVLDCVEIPAGTGRFYAVAAVDDVGKGFPNEYRFALLLHMDTSVQTLTANPWAATVWPIPYP